MIVTTCAVALVAASAAAANDVTLWACHGPGGEPLGSSVFYLDSAAGDCDTAAGVLSARLTAGGQASIAVGTPQLPLNVALESVTLARAVDVGSGRYAVTADSTPLADPATPADGELTLPLPAPARVNRVTVGIGCDAACGVDVKRIGLTVSDDAKPYAVGGIGSDVSGIAGDRDGTVAFSAWASDVGVGLYKAEAYVDGALVDSAYYGDDSCRDLTPDTPAIDLRLGASCPLTDSRMTLSFRSREFTDGAHTFTLKVFDAAGNEYDPQQDHPFTITNHPDPGNPTATLTIGSGGTTQGSGATNGGGGVAGARATSCGSPRLSMFLSQKPLRVSRGVPVLASGKRYRFRGRLTCVIAGKRRSAPRRTRVDLFNTLRGRTFQKGGTTVRDHGRITIILAYRSSRTLIFRYTNADGRSSQVKIRVKVLTATRKIGASRPNRRVVD